MERSVRQRRTRETNVWYAKNFFSKIHLHITVPINFGLRLHYYKKTKKFLIALTLLVVYK